MVGCRVRGAERSQDASMDSLTGVCDMREPGGQPVTWYARHHS